MFAIFVALGSLHMPVSHWRWRCLPPAKGPVDRSQSEYGSPLFVNSREERNCDVGEFPDTAFDPASCESVARVAAGVLPGVKGWRPATRIGCGNGPFIREFIRSRAGARVVRRAGCLGFAAGKMSAAALLRSRLRREKCEYSSVAIRLLLPERNRDGID